MSLRHRCHSDNRDKPAYNVIILYAGYIVYSDYKAKAVKARLKTLPAGRGNLPRRRDTQSTVHDEAAANKRVPRSWSPRVLCIVDWEFGHLPSKQPCVAPFSSQPLSRRAYSPYASPPLSASKTVTAMSTSLPNARPSSARTATTATTRTTARRVASPTHASPWIAKAIHSVALETTSASSERPAERSAVGLAATIAGTGGLELGRFA